MGAVVLLVVLASAQLAAAFVPLAPSSFGGRGLHARPTATSVHRNVRLPAIVQLKAADNTALSEFSGVDASGNQVKLHTLHITLICSRFLYFCF